MNADLAELSHDTIDLSDFCGKTHEGKTICHKVHSKLSSIKNKLMFIKEKELYLNLCKEDSHFVHR